MPVKMGIMHYLRACFVGMVLFWAFPTMGAVFFQVSDTTAGEASRVHLSGLLKGEKVGFELEKPDKKRIRFAAQADEEGVLQTEVYGLHLQQAGTYRLKAIRETLPLHPLQASFRVVPGKVSAYKSKVIVANPSVPANGEAFASVKVILQDSLGNPLPDYPLKVITSRNSDVVLFDPHTDKEGVGRGKIRSKTPGVSVVSVLAGDTVLFDKPEIIFHLPTKENLLEVGNSGFSLGDFLKAQLFEDDFGEVAYFSLEELPSEVVADRNYSVKVVAKDKDGKVVKSYTGKIRFSSTDSEAQLPYDYKFQPEDQGEHLFALAVTFGTPGQQTITVNDLANFEIKGEKTVTVLASDKAGEGDTERSLVILTPTEGASSASRLVITGKGPAGEAIKIMDGTITLVEDLQIDANGDFTYQTPSLADGLHKFKALTMDESLISNEVAVRIDTTPPQVLAVEPDPPEVNPGEVFHVKVSSNEPLASVNCTFNDISQDFVASGDIFVGNYQAPAKCGEYPIACTASDLLGNELTEQNAATVKVCTAQEEDTMGKDTDKDGIPDSVEGYEADDDKDCVPNWLEPKNRDSTGNGINDQEDPTNDTDGDGLTNIAECTECKTDPLNKEDKECKKGDTTPTGGTPTPDAPSPTPSENNSVPQVNRPIPPTAVFLTARSGDKRIYLQWTAATDDTGISRYKILYGESPDKLYQFNETPDDRTSWYVEHLKPGTRYYFQVIAVDTHGNESPPSNLVEVSTLGEVFHSSAVPQSGFNTYAPFILAIFGGLLLLFFARRRG